MALLGLGLEHWIPVVGYEGYYEVSDHGRVRSIDRVVEFPDGRSRRCVGIIRSLATLQSGHKTVSLHRDNKSVTKLVHRLVLEAFIGPCPQGMECRHGNDTPHDNRVMNLSWGTRSNNLYDMVRNGKHWEARKGSCPYGHLLAAPNLTNHSVQTGTRDCLACNRAYSRARYARQRNHPYDVEQLRSECYAKIMMRAVA